MPTIKGVRSIGDSAISLGKDKVISSYSLEYVVLADNLNQGPITIRSTSGLPLVGIDTYSFGGESDLTAVCKRKRPRQDTKQKLVWYVTCDFDNDPSSQSSEDEQNQPGATSRPLLLEWDSEYGERAIFKDFSSTPKACLSSNGEPFDPPLTTPIVYPVLNVTKYQTTFTVATKLQYENKVNSAPWNGAAAYTVLCSSIRATQVVEDGTQLWRVTYRFRYNPLPDGYLSMPLNRGTFYYPGGTRSDSNRKYFKTAEQVPYIGILTATGDKASEGSETYGGYVGTLGGNTYTAGFKAYESVAFSGLGLTF